MLYYERDSCVQTEGRVISESNYEGLLIEVILKGTQFYVRISSLTDYIIYPIDYSDVALYLL